LEGQEKGEQKWRRKDENTGMMKLNILPA